MLNDKLENWIHQSESWQAFIDFKIKKEFMKEYTILERSEDFFFTLYSNAIDIIIENDFKNRNKDLVLLGKGLEIYVLDNKRNYFKGVNYLKTALLICSMYYLADYPTSSYVLLNKLNIEIYKNDIILFLYDFFSRKLTNSNIISNKLNHYLNTGIKKNIINIKDIIDKKIEKYRNTEISYFILSILCKAVINKFFEENIIVDLLKYNKYSYWKDFINTNVSKEIGIWEFFPSQRKAIHNKLFSFNTAMSLKMPTSSGKTQLSELLIYNEFKQNPNIKILYLAPFRALAFELKSTLSKNLKKYGITVKTLYGGSVSSFDEELQISDSNVIISTPEKFIALENHFTDFLISFNLIICDEGHLLDDESRGLEYELLIARIKSHYLNQKRILFLSAIIPNINEINNWLGNGNGILVESDYRPTEIQYGFLIHNKFYSNYEIEIKYINNESFKLYDFLPEEVKYIKSTTKKENTINYKKVPSFRTIATAFKCLNLGSVAIFTTTKLGTNGIRALGNMILKYVEFNHGFKNPIEFISNFEELNNLYEYCLYHFGKEYLLTKLLKIGVVFHHGDLPQQLREIIENYLNLGFIKIVLCTSTITEGINLPIRCIILHTLTRYNYDTEKIEPIPFRDIKNLIGRSGRAGKETSGIVISTNERYNYILEKVRMGKNIKKINGALRKIIKEIINYLRKYNLQLTNDLINKSDEKFKEWIDAVDLSLIDLLDENIEIEEVDNIMISLIEQTFAYFMNTDEENDILIDVVRLRSEILKEKISAGIFPVIKKCGINIRILDDINGIFDYSKDIWFSESSNLMELFNELWKDIIQLEYYRNKFIDFATKNNLSLNDEIIFNILIMWCSKKRYIDICEEIGIDIDYIFRIINYHIAFTIQKLISHIITLIENYNNGQLTINPVLKIIPECLIYGLQNKNHITLHNFGIADRESIFYIEDYLNEENINIDKNIKKVLFENKVDILKKAINRLPELSIKRLDKFLR